MIITIPSCPSSFLFEIKTTQIAINNIIYFNVNSVLIFHIVTGKYITGYNEHGKRIFSFSLPSNIDFLEFDNDNLSYQ